MSYTSPTETERSPVGLSFVLPCTIGGQQREPFSASATTAALRRIIFSLLRPTFEPKYSGMTTGRRCRWKTSA